MEDIQEEPKRLPPKSTRTFDEWKKALVSIIIKHTGKTEDQIKHDDEYLKIQYDAAKMPAKVFNEKYRS